LVDLRTHPEFYAGHIEGTDHISAGVIYTFPKKVKDPNAEIVVWCRTGHRARYNAGLLYEYGYKNVWVWNGGIVDWIDKGYPLVNQFMGKFKVVEYQKNFAERDDEGQPLWRVRDFHPY
jgi:rhodanese-related sulfurtransferase